jgi:probable rRNA maturation factor
LSIFVQFSDDLSHLERFELKKLLTRARLHSWVKHALQSTHPDDAITLRIVSLQEGRALNKSYRHKDYATNVLTFDYIQSPCLHTDIVLCAPVIAQEAREQNKPILAHWAHLVIHGILHAQGYEHETHERDALEMEALEVLLMGALSFPNPY